MGLGACISCLVNGYREDAVTMFLGCGLCLQCGSAAWAAYLKGAPAASPQVAADTAAKLPPHPR